MYQVIYADPPWQYKTKECLTPNSILNGKLNKVYSTLTLRQIQNIDIKSICSENSMLFLWVVSPMLDDGISTIQSWGFKYSTIAFVWQKQRTNPGHYTMSSCEICLLGRRGKIPVPRGSRNVRQFLSELRTSHSTKPNEIRSRIDLMFPTQKKIELFARNRFDGWDAWGNEVVSDISLSIPDVR